MPKLDEPWPTLCIWGTRGADPAKDTTKGLREGEKVPPTDGFIPLVPGLPTL